MTEGSLDRRAGRGALWSLGGYGGGQAIRMASNLVLTRLLVPEHFGIMLVVNTAILGVQLFTEVGIGHSIVQNRRGDEPDFLRTAWTLQVIRGLFLWGALCALAVPIAGFYGDDQLRSLLPVAGLTALFQGLNSTRIAGYRRRLRLKALTVLQLGEQGLAALVMIAWAAFEPSVWALVAGGVVASFVVMALSHLVLEGPRDGFRFEGAATRELVRFGRWIFLSTSVLFVVNYADRLIVSKLVSLDVAGVYGIAVMIAAVPTAALGAFATNVAFPLFSQIEQRGEGLPRAFRRVRAPVNAVAGWAISGLLVGGPVAVKLLWTEPYWDAGWMVQLLAAGVWPGVILVASNNAGLLARGHSRLTAASSAAKLGGMLIAVPAGYGLLGLPGLILGFALSEVCRYAVSTWAAVHYGLRDWASDLALTARIAATALVGHLGVGVLEAAGSPVAVSAAAVLAFVTAAWAPLLLPIARRLADGRSPFEALEEPA